ncbi:MAG: hypothetical protein IM585_10250 [Pseudanabaena sp. M135S2SP2A07QC]|nr:hypothetical protein [Pseudanabaena sp. M090S1SP2A07QC]MCA6506140.1 hypothetical protein [Pseudanabaena sp. M172S2SP2A07QC]MCA6521580.1 hypothetical protein [Pseudanabaena sp. M051S1SP2A07QC]MCA6527583.1 hypothetical protein [Pseudanabaena sp. M179S2SP2A07QC]MCA6532494.1 hypothetical protein [Pseudanabaena sp. M125S2SP2A07QC]MCA6532791.1 hypothetical protein [Pseudanabaena sp. M176S2SP2A07QC]MCA6540692.1 hypothetical protein [Pseudanabaena sp. M037S2SP2A07QC]MCA6549732.1 hypothetical prot
MFWVLNCPIYLLRCYIAYGWLLSVHKADWRIWIPAGAIAFGVDWLFSLGWAISAVIFVFYQKSQFLLSLGISVVWVLLIYVARNELRAFMNNRGWNFFVLALIAGTGLGLGWFTDTLPTIRTFGESLIK